MFKKETKILVVEDDYIIARDIKNILENKGYIVFTDVTTVNEAIKTIEEINPNLILIDIKINGDKDGIYLGNYLLKEDKIPYIYISSYTDNITLEKILDTRPFGFISKPFKEFDLISNVAIALNNSFYKNIDANRNNLEHIKDDIPFRIRNAIQYINENLNNKIEITHVAEVTNWKIHHFIRVFTRVMGITPYRYVLNAKINKAKTLLIETNLPILEIAYDLGFQSYSNFCHTFKKLTSLAPENYRRESQAKNLYKKNSTTPNLLQNEPNNNYNYAIKN